MDLRGYQKIQNDAVRNAAKKGKRRIISCMSTGAGKSIQIAELTKTATDKGSTVTIVLPRRSLVKQLSKSFTEWGINHGVIMAGHGRFTQPRVQIISIDTYMSRLSSGRMEVLKSDLLIIDELHLQLTKKKMDIFNKYPFVIGFTATPVAPKKQALGMFYDEIIETISMHELIEQGFLSPITYYVDPTIDVSSLKVDASGDYRESQLGEVMDKVELVGDIFKNWYRIAKGKPTVVFTSSQSHALHITNEFCSHGFKFEYVDCNTKDEERQEIFDRVRNGETLGICNVGIVSVGIDIPNLEVCVLARPTKSIAIYRQCVGRVTRIYPGKINGIVIDHAGIIQNLGIVEGKINWTLDGGSIEERVLKEKQESKAPKEIICKNCNYVFTSRRECPKCGAQMIKTGEPIPYHDVELKELKMAKISDKEAFYSELLGYCMKHKKTSKYALAVYRSKTGEWPKVQNIPPKEPSPETLGYIKHTQIRWSHAKKGRHAVSESGRGTQNIREQMAG